MTKNLEQIAADIVSNSVCPDLALEAIQLVMGHGNPDADIVFIGEAPGKKEDEQGIPFIGAAGKLLSEMLESIKLSRDDVYITNIVKYRPPKNRDPTPAEKQAFWPYLIREIEVVRPKVVVTLGRHSMDYFLPEATIGEVHGQLQSVKVGDSSVQLLPLYHPAATIYNRSLRQTLFEDFAKLPDILAETSSN